MSDAKTPGRKARLLRRVGVWAILASVGGAVVRMFGCAEGLFYYPSRAPFQTPPAYEDIAFSTPDGLTLHGWFMPAVVPPGEDPEAPRPAVLHAHGNAGNVSYHHDYSDFLRHAGFHVLLFDYRSYGRSDKGSLRRDGLMIDTHAALDALLARPEVDASRVGVLGVSLGGSFAAALAAERDEARSLCIIAGFASWKGVAGDHAPLVGGLLIPGGLDARDAVARLGDRPLLIVHGDADGVVRVRHGHALEEAARAAGVDVELRVSPGANHTDILYDDPSAPGAIAAFFRRTLGAAAGDPPGDPAPAESP